MVLSYWSLSNCNIQRIISLYYGSMGSPPRGIKYLERMQPVPSVGWILELEDLNDPDKHFGLVIWQYACYQAFCVV